MNRIIKIQATRSLSEQRDYEDFLKVLDENIEVGLSSLSAKNRKQYEATFNMWLRYASGEGLDSYDFDLIAVKDFLTSNEWSFNTRKVRLAHLKKFAELLALADSDNKHGYAFNFGRLGLLKPKSLGGAKNVIKQRELKANEVFTLFNAIGSDSNADTRNRAILGIMLLSGLRSSEVARLKWEHIDFERRRIFIAEGKGGKDAFVPMLGNLWQLLFTWDIRQALSLDTEFVCSAIDKSDNVIGMKAITAIAIGNFIRKLSAKTGIDFRPHDTRRTAISNLIDNGVSVAKVRDFARHASGETTLIYAQGHDASTLGVELKGKLSYGDVWGDLRPSMTDNYTRKYECNNGHKFEAYEPSYCPKCQSEILISQVDIFDDEGE